MNFSQSITKEFADIHQIIKKLRLVLQQRFDIVNKEQNIILIKMQNISPECSNQMRILFQKEDKLRQISKDKYNKKCEIDQKELFAKQILSEQIDNISQEELFVQTIEKNVSMMLQENENLDFSNSDSQNENLIKEIIQIENENMKRKSFLNSYKKEVENLKMSVSRSNITCQNQNLKSGLNNKISNHNDQKQITNQVKLNIEKQFFDRKTKLESLQNEIHQMEEKINQDRADKERSFNQKLSRIEELSKQLIHSKTDASFLKSENSQLKIKLASIIQEKAAIIRKITNIDRDKGDFANKNNSIEKKLRALVKKKKNIKLRQNEINNRSRQLKKFRMLIKSKEDELAEYEQKILNLEKEVIDIENQNSYVLDQIKIAHSANVSIIKNKQLRNIIIEQTDNDDVFKLSQLE